ncbi:predicted protein [Postia placenta Mad-698-R]|uniref:C2H2-type domain-containing protein n=1 Tax=Postia placenta MAD-698-R-SB12 TaxID=670580 RepID=A0A1X6MX75_9APHY|nr:hypothetical protein POSPLADRAFT_1146254 [Postia placenta MAD-698-R-SB12]EED85657.1 predicted protein [Postia placenta Mad-698-R]OSX60964.1 hypothetical protein POSPLADRAFT_1146254 [Postia placenta MAD-698-R-SB12]
MANEAHTGSEVDHMEHSEPETTGCAATIASPDELSSAAPSYILAPTIEDANASNSPNNSEHDTPPTVGPSTAPQGQKRKSPDTDDDEDFPWQYEFPDDEDAYDQDNGENKEKGGDAIEEAEENGGFDPEERHIRDTATAGPDGRWECPAPNCGKLLSSLEIMVRHWKGCKKRPSYQSIPCLGCDKFFARGDAMRRHHRNPNACEGYVTEDEARPKRGRGGGGGRKRARRG